VGESSIFSSFLFFLFFSHYPNRPRQKVVLLLEVVFGHMDSQQSAPSNQSSLPLFMGQVVNILTHDSNHQVGGP
ncbi:hypothetical protein PJP10_32345, partial [Mycobacterium kansasii]